MIDENLTYKFYGYHSFDWYEGSAKIVIDLCDNCSKPRAIRKTESFRLCKSCGNKPSEKAKEKSRKTHMKENLSDKTREKMSNAKIGKVFTKEHREKLSITHRGEKSSFWKGGITTRKYCYKFNESKKKEIRNKYNDCDFISGLHKNIINNNYNLDIHHIDYNKEQGCNSEWKLIPLSRSNHSKTNSNRWFWNKLFINVLEIDKWYYK